jgi:sortase A
MSALLSLAGVTLLALPWLTDLYTREIVQRRLREDIRKPEVKVAYEQRHIKEGDGLTRLVIPKLAVDVVVVEGISPAALRAGAGHYPETPLPGEKGNMAIAGHRTTYGKPFADINLLSEGDDLYLETPMGAYLYKVTGDPLVIEPTDHTVLDATPAPTLTLTTCHPRFSAAFRLVVHAQLAADRNVKVPGDAA